MVLLLGLMLLLPCIPAASAAGGSCGDGLTWSLDGDTLTISGSGAMDNYSEASPAPWYSSRASIMRVSLPDGLTRVGSWAFADCTNLSAVTIPSSVEIVGDYGFYRCSGMTILSLSNGLRTIGQCAFEQCSALTDLRLPDTLLTIGDHAFYLCKSLTYVTVPGVVKSFGTGVFCYCENLIRVDVNASITLPSWTFYGCDRLQTVTVEGASVNPESLKIATPPTGSSGVATSGSTGETESDQSASGTPDEEIVPTQATEPAAPTPESGTASSSKLTTDNDGTQVLDQTTVKKTDNSTTTNTTTTTTNQDGDKDVQTQITATVVNPDGWEEVIEQIETALINQGDDSQVDVTVYIQDTDTIEKDILQDLAGKNVSLTIQTQSGSQYILDCANLSKDIAKDLELTYTLTLAEEIPESMEGCTVYQLNFAVSTDIALEIIMRLPGDHSHQTATLYQLEKSGEPCQLQSVMVDSSGNAHWYLQSVDRKTDYLIGINIPGAIEDSPIIPAELLDVYKVANVYDGVEYVVTGRTSSWNMNLGQVMGILAAVMGSVIVIVGVVMYVMNKRRLKSGYVPQWDDEDYE